MSNHRCPASSSLSDSIPKGLESLANATMKLKSVAEYCEANYLEASNKREALEETKQSTAQCVTAVANQVHNLARNFTDLLNLQASQLDTMSAQCSSIAQSMAICEERSSRRHIGLLTSSKTTTGQFEYPKMFRHTGEEQEQEYIRKKVDFTVLDHVKSGGVADITLPKQKGSHMLQSGPTTATVTTTTNSSPEQILVPKRSLVKVMTIREYSAKQADELSFQVNQTIYVLKYFDDGWAEGVLDGKTGVFPGNYVKPWV